jgi:hypothetical protein
MIVVKLSDGLGNQMFQYALGRQLAISNGEEVKFDTSWFKHSNVHSGTNRSMTINGFDISFKQATRSDVSSVVRTGRVITPFRHKDTIFELFPRFWGHFFNYYKEITDEAPAVPAWAYRRRFYPEILNIQGDAYIDGYWQAYQYFEQIRDILIEDFTVPSKMSGANKRIMEQINEATSVSVHVRRGDQLDRGPSSDEFGNAERPSYYYRAGEYVTETVDTNDLQFFIFSDDPEWCKTGLNFEYPTTVVDQNDGSTDYKDMHLMRQCDHHIMASSTFSWWGAWLSENEEKIVIAPKPWKQYGYPDGIVEEWDLIPEDWLLLPDK